MPTRPKIIVTTAGNTITVTDGKRTRSSICATSSSAKSLSTRLTKDVVFAAKWMRSPEPVQLVLPLGDEAC